MTKQVSARGLKWFQDARFGMFIHWGPTAILARHDAPMHAEEIPIPEYRAMALQMNPTKFDAGEWARLAVDAGQKYIVFTSRHHDGFSMYDTALTDYKITNTPFKRDPVAELAEACTRRGIKLGFYSSLLDWYHPAYRSKERWPEFVEFIHGQVRELCTNYGEIVSMWFDGYWPRHRSNPIKDYFVAAGDFEFEKLFDMIHSLQPDAVILNNTGEAARPGEDARTFEQYLPGEETSPLPQEVNMTINDHWFYVAHSRNFKTSRALIHYLVRSAASGANYLLNVGPNALGEIIPEHAQRLRALGAWLDIYGESIYGTTASEIEPIRIFENPWKLKSADPNSEHMQALKHWIQPLPEIQMTRKGDVHYIHVLDFFWEWVLLDKLPANITRAYTLKGEQPLKIEDYLGFKAVHFPTEALRDPLDTVIVLAP